MRFSVRKRRTAPAVIIVALIDVLVVLLIFLMVTTTFKQQPSLKLALPASSAAEKTGAEEHPPVEVSIDTEGNYRFDREQNPLTVDQLRGQLLERAARDPDLKLSIRADKKAAWEKVVAVMDIARAAKIKSLSAVTRDTPKP